MTGVCPAADDGLQTVGNIALVYQEIAAVEEGGYGSAKKQRPHDAVDDEADLKGLWSKKITYLVLEFIAHGLDRKSVASSSTQRDENGSSPSPRSSPSAEPSSPRSLCSTAPVSAEPTGCG